MDRERSEMSYDKFPRTMAHSFYVLIRNIKALQMLLLVSALVATLRYVIDD